MNDNQAPARVVLSFLFAVKLVELVGSDVVKAVAGGGRLLPVHVAINAILDGCGWPRLSLLTSIADEARRESVCSRGNGNG